MKESLLFTCLYILREETERESVIPKYSSMMVYAGNRSDKIVMHWTLAAVAAIQK
jgi:hypothetical protein